MRYLLAILPIFFTISITQAQQLLDETLFHEGVTREYSLYLPAGYDGSTRLPLLFNFHGGNGDIAGQIALADMHTIADTAGFLVVYPQALPDPNDDGSANWLHKAPTEVDDVFFVDAMIAAIRDDYQIDETRIYACGYSLGGEFSYELACRLNEEIAAVGVVARTMGTSAFNNCAPTHPTGILTILGTDDFISPYEGLIWGGIEYYLSADATHDYWASYNNTSAMPSITALPNTSPFDGSTVERHRWSAGDACVTVEHLKVIGGGHDWPGSFGNEDINASLEIWNYVSRYTLDGLIGCATTSVYAERPTEATITLYPNPVSDQLWLRTSLTGPQSYEVYAASGQRVLAGRLSAASDHIDVSGLPTGIYGLRVVGRLLRFVK